MDKKGEGWSTIVIILVILVSAVIIIGLWMLFGEHLIQTAQTSKESLLEAFKS